MTRREKARRLTVPALFFASLLAALGLLIGVWLTSQTRGDRAEAQVHLVASGYVARCRAPAPEDEALAARCEAELRGLLAAAGRGSPGAAGSAGRDGRDGTDGRDGRDGINGAEGPAGPAGEDGTDGAPGADGAPGQGGLKGDRGERGEAGAPATLPPIIYCQQVFSEAEDRNVIACRTTGSIPPR